MRRAAPIAAVLLLAAGVAVLLATGSSRSAGPYGNGPYQVQAIFDNAAFAVSGEDVRIAGAPAGSITSLSVTSTNQAAVTLTIANAGFIPFHANATCAIRPQSLIAERFVDCNPGTSAAPPLQLIRRGPGAGSYLLPVTQTSSPIDVDIVQDISQEPIRQRLSVILDELGTGLAARGADLNAVIRRADPALGYTDQVFQILAQQNEVLAQLATDSDTVLAPLARARAQIAGFVTAANTTAVASAQRSSDIARSIQLLPSFLSRLRPLMADLGALADQGTPVVSSLDESASALDRQFAELVPFASAARTALIDLGNAAQQSQAPLVASESLATRLSKLGAAAVPSSALLDQLTASLDKSGAINQLMRLLFYGTGASNGFDANGHYLRTSAIFGNCTAYALSPQPGCSSNFGPGAAAADVASAAGPPTPNRAGARSAGRSTTPGAAGQGAGGASGAAGLAQAAPSGASEQPTKLAQDPAAVAAVVREALALSPPPRSSPLAGLLQYLIGGAR
ncbi:MAG: MlaD family protein [Solirubrobacteraceae bacterium]